MKIFNEVYQKNEKEKVILNYIMWNNHYWDGNFIITKNRIEEDYKLVESIIK